ncbi:aa3-type cytochrome c oxidase subunit IV [Allosphingosinicella indica]|uniref:Aa3 type cytochrome c oxidase subunit IV n=1 Tax=Allosphingosinicella indica TaxID=941907 RepID=A0A1X7GI67_9SPHN|nr:aa3-type cytochrome c oxidase subunit IV [Allosphingosinicella indica]SMF70145.1 aa3 type cytochrome c oxidase subunit IV [Allosphingosinicella indica]
MANEGDHGMDMPAHERSYELFYVLMKWGTIISFVVAMFVVFVLIA